MIRLRHRPLFLGLLVLFASALPITAQDPGGGAGQDPDPAVDAETARRRAEWAAASLEFLVQKYDADGNGVVVRAEYTGTDKYWARLDRNRDGQLTLPDWDLEPKEKPMREPMRPPKVKGLAPHITVQRIRIEGGPRFHLLQPGVEDNGKPKTVRLDTMLDGRPGLLFFANSAAPGAREVAPEMARLSREYPGIRYILVYGPERYAVDGLRGMPPSGDVPLLEEPTSFDARVTQARVFVKEFGLENYNVLVDRLDNLSSRIYRGEHGRVYLITQGRVVRLRSKPAHRGMDVKTFENAIRVMLNMDLLGEE